MKLYHGTSYENYLNIMKHGINTDNKTWNCSWDDKMYFYNPKELIKQGECNTEDDAVRTSIEDAFFNARITAALNRSNSDKIIVLELDIEEEKMSIDSSDGYVGTAVEVEIDDIDLNKDLTKVFTASYCPNISLMYLINHYDNPFLESNFSNAEKAMLKYLKSIDYIPEEIFEIKYEEYNDTIRCVI